MNVANHVLNRIALPCVVLMCLGGAYVHKNDAPQGVWESPDNLGGAVGIDLQEARQENGRAILEIAVYERARDGLRCGDENFFQPRRSDPQDTSTVSYSDGLLVIHYKDRAGRDKSIDMNLTFNPGDDQWRGSFHRGTFDENVVLKRVPKQPVVLEPCIFG